MQSSIDRRPSRNDAMNTSIDSKGSYSKYLERYSERK